MATDDALLKLGLPKGHMREEVFALLRDAGIRVRDADRNYRPVTSLDHADAKMMKPQNIIGMLEGGSRDVGFAGADWVEELDADLVELLDTGLDPVRVVAAAPEDLVADSADLSAVDRPVVVASEYENITRDWIDRTGLDARYVRSFGATEAFPPEDADCIVDNSATGRTLEANHLAVVDVLMESSTRLYTTEDVLDDPDKASVIDEFVLLLESVLEARDRVMLEVNVAEEKLEEVVDVLPCMREPTIASLSHGSGYAVKVAMSRSELPTVIPAVEARGGTDVVVTSPSHIVT
ncbi:MAG: ATP phosphoribosyltransferase [Bradymonadaceae bacterium]